MKLHFYKIKMISTSILNLRPTPITAKPEPPSKPPSTNTRYTPYLTTNQTTSEANSDSKPRKPKGSAQLNRWSRARAIRSGRKLNRSGDRPPVVELSPVNKPTESGIPNSYLVESGNDRDDDVEATAAKSIYMVSDGTGWTAEHSVGAALGQFDYCFVDRGCPVNTHLFSGVEDGQQLMEIVKQAAKEDAILVYTLADPSMAESARKACKLWGVASTDILGPITEAIASHLGVSPSGIPRGAPGSSSTLNEEYFKRIEAIEFTIKQDDGALPENLHKADIVLVGVSRTGKTPLSTYLAQKGYKVANVPIVKDIPLPKSLFEIDPEKVFGLTINPVVLQAIRRARAKTLGFDTEGRSNYSEMYYVRDELELGRKIFAQNPVWPVIQVTGKAIEESAAVILKLYHDRKQKCSMPRISKRY